MMNAPHAMPNDPLKWHVIVALAFAMLVFFNLGIPSKPMFDEVHYVPAIRALLENGAWLNREHPMLGKEITAGFVALFGDTPLVWRIPAALCGVATLFAAMRALFFATGSGFTSLAYGMLLITGFILFVQSRIFMLDIFMICFVMVALWQFAAAMHGAQRPLLRLYVAGIAIGLALGSKWNMLLLAPLPGLCFAAARFMEIGCGRRNPISVLLEKNAAPIRGVALWQAAIALGIVPLIVYWLTYFPAHFAPDDPLPWDGFMALHQKILALQSSVTQTHPYQSTWVDWVLNRRSIWYLYEHVDGAQRGIIMLGNPATMIVGLAALYWTVWVGITRMRWDALAVAASFLASIGIWIMAAKPVQFYYHYALPSVFLLAALALALGEFWQKGVRWIPYLTLGFSAALFVYFYPILSAAPLADAQSFTAWTWLDGWR